MGLFWTGTMVNLGANLLLWRMSLLLYGRSKDLGRQKAAFTAERIRVRERWRKLKTPWLYRVEIRFRGCRQILMVTEAEYEALLHHPTGETFLYVREFASRLLNPDLEKYAFSLKDPDWEQQDRRRCRICFLLLAAFLEALLAMIALGV